MLRYRYDESAEHCYFDDKEPIKEIKEVTIFNLTNACDNGTYEVLEEPLKLKYKNDYKGKRLFIKAKVHGATVKIYLDEIINKAHIKIQQGKYLTNKEIK